MDSWHHLLWGGTSPILTSKELFCACIVGEVSFTKRKRNMWSFTSYLGRARPPPLSSYYGVSVIEQKLFSLGSALSPASISVPGWRVVPFSEKGNSGRRSSLGRALGRQIKLKGIWSLPWLSTFLSRLQTFTSSNLWRKGHYYPHFTDGSPRKGGWVTFLRPHNLWMAEPGFQTQTGWLQNPHSTISDNADSHRTLLRHVQLEILVGQVSGHLLNNLFNM